MNAATLRRSDAQARRILAEAYAHARQAARAGDLGPAEALLEFLRAYLPAINDHRAAGLDWTSMSRRMSVARIYRAAQALSACRYHLEGQHTLEGQRGAPKS